MDLQAEIEVNVQMLKNADDALEKRIVIIEEEIELLKKRPSNAADIDWTAIASK